MEQRKTPLLDAIVDYTTDRPVYFKIPGHRYEKGISLRWRQWTGDGIFRFDLTEAEGLDDLHEPEGVIREAQELAAEVFHAKKTYFLVNGTTCGNEAMVLASVKEGEKIMVARNAHKSVLMGLTLSGAVPIYLIPKQDPALNIFLLCKLKAFRTAYPGIRLKIYNYSSPQAIAAVKSGKIDFAVLSTPVPTEPPLHLTPLQSFREILIGGPSFSALSEKELCFSDLKKYPFICLGRETATFQFYNQLFLSQELELIPDTEAATTDQILPLVKNNLGLAFLPEPMALESLAKQEVLQIAISEKLPLRDICLVHDHQHPLNSGARELKKIILGERMD